MSEDLDMGTPRLGVEAMGVACIALCLVWVSIDEPGLVWDEPGSASFAQRYIFWFTRIGQDALSSRSIRWAWGEGQAHPPLAKVGIALGIAMFHPVGQRLAKFHVCAIRLPSACYFALLVGIAYWWMARAYGKRAGLMAALAVVLTPRLFGHAHFGTIDMPVTALWLVTVALFSQVERSRRFVWPSAIALGAALLTKINAVAIGLVLAPYGVWRLRRRALAPLVTLAVVSMGMFFMLWPYLWLDPWRHLCEYIRDKASRPPKAVYYLGRTYVESYPPWHYPWVLTLATTPLTFLMGAAGAMVLGLKRRNPTVVLLTANAGAMLVVASLPFVPKYDGVRLFLPAFPFLACLAGIGFDRLLTRIRRPALAWMVGVGLFASPAVEMVHLHPFYLSYYSETVGWLAGARALGFEPTYWGDTLTAETIAYLNQACEPKAKVAFFPLNPMIAPIRQQATRELREDLLIVSPDSDSWRYLVLLPRYGYFDRWAWAISRRALPLFSVNRWGVRLCAVYRR